MTERASPTLARCAGPARPLGCPTHPGDKRLGWKNRHIDYTVLGYWRSHTHCGCSRALLLLVDGRLSSRFLVPGPLNIVGAADLVARVPFRTNHDVDTAHRLRAEGK